MGLIAWLQKPMSAWIVPSVGAVALLGAIALHNCDRAKIAEAQLRARESIDTLERAFQDAVGQASVVASAQRAAHAIAQAVIDAVWLAEVLESEREIARAAQEAETIDEEFRATGRVTESAKRAYLEMMSEGDE